MKALSSIGAIISIGMVIGCGGGNGPEATGGNAQGITTTQSAGGEDVLSVPGNDPKPKIQVPSKPPPRNLVVNVLKDEDGGPKAHWGDRLGVRFVGVDYKTKRVFEDRWNQPKPFSFRFGDGEVREGWEIGLKGMSLGDQRELTLPSRLAYGTGALIYVVELVELGLAR